MRVLVTGGAGYIGSHTCKALARAGHVPIVYDNLTTGNLWAVKWGPFERGDLLDTARLQEAIDAHKPDAVIHFAASAYVGESVADPRKYYRNNVTGTLSLLDAMRAGGIDKIVFSSSCATYGLPQSLPMAETHPQMPINPYGRTKLVVEHILSDYGHADGLRSVSLRYFNAAGADLDGEIGELHDPEPHLIPLVLQAAAGQRDSVTIHGDDYETPDGTCVRDYIHVSDLADAHLRALDMVLSSQGTFAYNLGIGRGYSVRDIVQAASRVTGARIPCVVGPRRAGDPHTLCADASLAREKLGWLPQHSQLDNIVRTAWDWLRRETQRA